MRLVTLFMIAAFAASTVDAASYLTTYGTIIDPILNRPRTALHPYSGANLEPGAFLPEADLRYADLRYADLRYADLWNADLYGAYLSNADLTNANLYGADLTYANLISTNLSNANLTDANLYGADLYYADLTNANLRWAYLANADLRAANLTGSNLTAARYWENAYWSYAYYYTDNIPTWGNDMNQAWRDSVGILAIDPTSGDFNSDSVFDAADYTVWQDNGGDHIDYRTWKDHFGQSIASGSGADPVPEPTTLLLALLVLFVVANCGTHNLSISERLTKRRGLLHVVQ